MADARNIGRSISENATMLSGAAALVVLGRVIFSPVGAAVRHLFARRRRTSATVSGTLQAAVAAPELPGTPYAPADSDRPDKQPSGTSETVLAVLPFDNLSSDAEMQYFSDGVSDEIIQRLSRGAKLAVRRPPAGRSDRIATIVDSKTSSRCMTTSPGTSR